MLLFIFFCSTAMAAPVVSPRQLVLPGAGTTTYWWPFPPSSSTTDIASSTITSSIAPSPTSSSPLHHVTLAKHPFNILYLIPVFAVVGLSILVGIIWLIHGCCTRKPKYRSLPRPQVDDSFKAWKYEDIPPPDRPCRHVRDYGFECDCRVEEDAVDDMGKVHVRDSHRIVVDHDVISSESPLSRLEARIKRDSSSSSSTDRWMGKVVNAFGSSVSSERDKYTPGSMRRNKLVKKSLETRDHHQQRRPRSTQISNSTSTSTPTADDEIEHEGEEEHLKRILQKRRLQNHRDSIASLPAGMVFSPPVVAFLGLGEGARSFS